MAGTTRESFKGRVANSLIGKVIILGVWALARSTQSALGNLDQLV